MIVIPTWLLAVAILCLPVFIVFDMIWRTVDNYYGQNQGRTVVHNKIFRVFKCPYCSGQTKKVRNDNGVVI